MKTLIAIACILVIVFGCSALATMVMLPSAPAPAPAQGATPSAHIVVPAAWYPDTVAPVVQLPERTIYASVPTPHTVKHAACEGFSLLRQPISV